MINDVSILDSEPAKSGILPGGGSVGSLPKIIQRPKNCPQVIRVHAKGKGFLGLGTLGVHSV